MAVDLFPLLCAVIMRVIEHQSLTRGTSTLKGPLTRQAPFAVAKFTIKLHLLIGALGRHAHAYKPTHITDIK